MRCTMNALWQYECNWYLTSMISYGTKSQVPEMRCTMHVLWQYECDWYLTSMTSYGTKSQVPSPKFEKAPNSRMEQSSRSIHFETLCHFHIMFSCSKNGAIFHFSGKIPIPMYSGTKFKIGAIVRESRFWTWWETRQEWCKIWNCCNLDFMPILDLVTGDLGPFWNMGPSCHVISWHHQCYTYVWELLQKSIIIPLYT
jgi:hypothetical protein